MCIVCYGNTMIVSVQYLYDMMKKKGNNFCTFYKFEYVTWSHGTKIYVYKYFDGSVLNFAVFN